MVGADHPGDEPVAGSLELVGEIQLHEVAGGGGGHPAFTNPSYVPPPADGSGVTFSLLEVADEAGRLSLPQPSALGRAIKQDDDGSIWSLVPGGAAHVAEDWQFLSVSGNVTHLASAPPPVAAMGGRLWIDAADGSLSAPVLNQDTWVNVSRSEVPCVGILSAGKSVRKVALAGDSHHNMMSAAGTTDSNAEVATGIRMYGADFLQVVKPPRDRWTHAIGGGRVDLFIDGHAGGYAGAGTVKQLDELLAQVAVGMVSCPSRLPACTQPSVRLPSHSG